MEIKQLTLNFEKGLADAWSSCREYVAYRVHHQGKPQKVVAADMDYSPSDLSRKLAQNPDDTRPVLYLVEKYLARSSREALEKQIAELQKQLEAGDE
jgi:hypothetical protein